MTEIKNMNDQQKSRKVTVNANPISPVILGTDLEKEDSNQTPEYKEYRRKWYENPKNFILERFPMHLDIELTNNCNYSCIMCPRRKMTREKGHMDIAVFKKIINEGAEKGLYAVNLNLLGEPLLYPHLEEAIRYCKEKGLLDVHLHTNAMLLNEKNAKMLINSGLDSIKISLDANNKETYEKIRIGGNFERVVENIKNFIKIRDSLGMKKPSVKINFIEMKDTAEEIAKSIEYWKPIVNQIAILRYIDFKVGENLSVYEIRKKNDFCCAFLWQKLSIHWDGETPICFRCSSNNDNSIGNIKNMTIEEIWNSPRLQEMRQKHQHGEYLSIGICSECHVPQEEMSKYIVGTANEKKIGEK